VGWTFFWMMFVLKIPVAAAFWLVWWATREPEPQAGPDDGLRRPRRDHPRPRRPGPTRRGPHAGARAASPPRVRTRAVALDRAHPRPG
jgi:hypothetical protein